MPEFKEIAFQRLLYMTIKTQLILELKPQKIKIVFYPSDSVIKKDKILPLDNEKSFFLSETLAEELINIIFSLICIQFNVPVSEPIQLSMKKIKSSRKIINNNKDAVKILKTIDLGVALQDPFNQHDLNEIKKIFLRIYQMNNLEQRKKIIDFLNAFTKTKNSHKYCNALKDQFTCFDIISGDFNNLIYKGISSSSAKTILKQNKNVITNLISANLIGQNGQNHSQNLQKHFNCRKSSDKTKLFFTIKCIKEIRNRSTHSSENHPLCKEGMKFFDTILRNYWIKNFKKLTKG